MQGGAGAKPAGGRMRSSSAAASQPGKEGEASNQAVGEAGEESGVTCCAEDVAAERGAERRRR